MEKGAPEGSQNRHIPVTVEKMLHESFHSGEVAVQEKTGERDKAILNGCIIGIVIHLVRGPLSQTTDTASSDQFPPQGWFGRRLSPVSGDSHSPMPRVQA